MDNSALIVYLERCLQILEEIKSGKVGYTIFPSEIKAAQIMSHYRGELNTNDSIKDDANYIIDLAHRIERERLDGASN